MTERESQLYKGCPTGMHFVQHVKVTRDQPNTAKGEWTGLSLSRLIKEKGYKGAADAHNAELAAEKGHHKQEEIAATELARQLAAERKKVQALVDAMKKIDNGGVRGSDTGWEGCLHPGIAKDALAKVKEGK